MSADEWTDAYQVAQRESNSDVSGEQLVRQQNFYLGLLKERDARIAELEHLEALLGHALMAANHVLTGDRSEASLNSWQSALDAVVASGWKYQP
jgi:hypothetical protein